MSKQQLAVRQVEPIDIATSATDYWSYAVGSNNIDFSNFRSEQTGRGPLCEGWQVCFFLLRLVNQFQNQIIKPDSLMGKIYSQFDECKNVIVTGNV